MDLKDLAPRNSEIIIILYNILNIILCMALIYYISSNFLVPLISKIGKRLRLYSGLGSICLLNMSTFPSHIFFRILLLKCLKNNMDIAFTVILYSNLGSIQSCLCLSLPLVIFFSSKRNYIDSIPLYRNVFMILFTFSFFMMVLAIRIITIEIVIGGICFYLIFVIFTYLKSDIYSDSIEVVDVYNPVINHIPLSNNIDRQSLIVNSTPDSKNSNKEQIINNGDKYDSIENRTNSRNSTMEVIKNNNECSSIENSKPSSNDIIKERNDNYNVIQNNVVNFSNIAFKSSENNNMSYTELNDTNEFNSNNDYNTRKMEENDRNELNSNNENNIRNKEVMNKNVFYSENDNKRNNVFIIYENERNSDIDDNSKTKNSHVKNTLPNKIYNNENKSSYYNQSKDIAGDIMHYFNNCNKNEVRVIKNNDNIKDIDDINCDYQKFIKINNKIINSVIERQTNNNSDNQNNNFVKNSDSMDLIKYEPNYNKNKNNDKIEKNIINEINNNMKNIITRNEFNEINNDRFNKDPKKQDCSELVDKKSIFTKNNSNILVNKKNVVEENKSETSNSDNYQKTTKNKEVLHEEILKNGSKKNYENEKTSSIKDKKRKIRKKNYRNKSLLGNDNTKNIDANELQNNIEIDHNNNIISNTKNETKKSYFSRKNYKNILEKFVKLNKFIKYFLLEVPSEIFFETTILYGLKQKKLIPRTICALISPLLNFSIIYYFFDFKIGTAPLISSSFTFLLLGTILSVLIRYKRMEFFQNIYSYIISTIFITILSKNITVKVIKICSKIKIPLGTISILILGLADSIPVIIINASASKKGMFKTAALACIASPIQNMLFNNNLVILYAFSKKMCREIVFFPYKTMNVAISLVPLIMLIIILNYEIRNRKLEIELGAVLLFIYFLFNFFTMLISF